ncbi:hypothetical protein V1505DRAFT_370341 [Lipomyces doorenjongii]
MTTGHGELMTAVRGPLSEDAQIDVPASRSEYQCVDDILEEEYETTGQKFPRLQYDGVRRVAIVCGPPSPLHGTMVGMLMTKVYNAVNQAPGVSRDISDRVSIKFPQTNATLNDGGELIVRIWDGALEYFTGVGRAELMVAFEVGISRSYEKLRAAISFSVCALHSNLGIAMSVNEDKSYTKPPIQRYATFEEMNTAIKEMEQALRSQWRACPYGPLIANDVTWFGKISNVVLETFRQEDRNYRPDTLLIPTQSFTIVEDGKFIGENVPSNLAELTIGDCIPTHILRDRNIASIPLDFFNRDWFEVNFSWSMMETAMNRVHEVCEFQPV